MNEEFGNASDKSAGDLGREAMWFIAHTLIAVALLGVVIFIVFLSGATIDAIQPKVIGIVLAFLVPAVGGFAIAKSRQDPIAGYVWIAGLLLFSIICVWVLNLPTGPGLCERCGALEKLYRTFFDITNGSGLMGGDGLLMGTMIPLSMIGYSAGAKMGLDT